jgi:hypothetical protein
MQWAKPWAIEQGRAHLVHIIEEKMFETIWNDKMIKWMNNQRPKLKLAQDFKQGWWGSQNIPQLLALIASNQNGQWFCMNLNAMIRNTSPHLFKEVVRTVALVRIRLVPFKRWKNCMSTHQGNLWKF